MEWIIELEQLAGVFGTMFVSTFFRPEQGAVSWQLPATAWLFVLFGVGMIMGIVVLATLTRIERGTQFTVALLGGISLTAGMASYLRLSAIAVCFLAGLIVFNMGGEWRGEVRAVLDRLERPIYFLFLVVAGALWRPWDWEGWAFMALFVLGRFFSKWIATVTLGRVWLKDLTEHERRVLVAAPMGALSVAVVVLAQDLYSGPFVGWSVTAVIGGSIVMEILLQVAMRRRRITEPAVEAA
jgi:Kef-type K+ transport system membrane component KefB